MHIGVDIRVLMGAHATGVPGYTKELLKQLLSFDTKNTYTFFSNSADQFETPDFLKKDGHAQHIHTRIPNKLFNARLCFFGRPYLDALVAKHTGNPVDVWVSPNIHFGKISERARHILVVHDISFLLHREFYTYKQHVWHHAVQFKKTIKQVQYIVVPSESTKKELVDFCEIDTRKILVLPPFFSDDTRLDVRADIRIALQKKFQISGNYFLFVGALEHRKNLRGLIDAFIRFKSSSEHAHEFTLIIAGAPGAHMRDIQKRIANHTDIRYIGYITEVEKNALMKGAYAFVYPSFYEGFGIPIYEAFMQGTPVITSNNTSMLEVAGAAGYFVHPYRLDELVDAFELFATDPDVIRYYKSKIPAQLETIKQKRNIEDFVNLYDS